MSRDSFVSSRVGASVLKTQRWRREKSLGWRARRMQKVRRTKKATAKNIMLDGIVRYDSERSDKG